jgi:hypothetical protein
MVPLTCLTPRPGTPQTLIPCLGTLTRVACLGQMTALAFDSCTAPGPHAASTPAHDAPRPQIVNTPVTRSRISTRGQQAGLGGDQRKQTRHRTRARIRRHGKRWAAASSQSRRKRPELTLCSRSGRPLRQGPAAMAAAANSSALVMLQDAPTPAPCDGPSCSTRLWKRTSVGRWPTLMRVTPASSTAFGGWEGKGAVPRGGE